MSENDNVFLIGYMGCGKTSVGRALAAEMNMPFVDTDQLLENRLEKSVYSIFEDHGEAFFRSQEKTVLTECCNESRTIISTGGGAVVNEDNLRLMKNSGVVVYLKLPVEVLVQRLKKDRANRPLLRGMSDHEIEVFVKRHFEERRNQYEKAHITFYAAGNISELKRQIQDLFSRRK